MKRKSILISGLFLSIVYALGLVASIALVFAGALYFFAGETFQIISDIFLPILTPFTLWGNTMMLVLIALLVVACILLLIISTKFLKYSRISKEKFAQKRNTLIFNYVIVLIATLVFVYLLISSVLNSDFDSNLLYNICLILIVLIHIMSSILIGVGFTKNRAVATIPNTPVSTNTEFDHPAIYTSDLEDKPEPTKEEIKKVETPAEQTQPTQQVQQPSVQQQQEQPKPVQKNASQNLVDEIGKLDIMRKNGEITQEQYVKMRQNLITRFIK